MMTFHIEDERLGNFIRKLIDAFDSLIIITNDSQRSSTHAISTDPDHGMIFDPDHGMIFDQGHDLRFDPKDAFDPKDGVPISHSSGSLFDSYGNRINKLDSMPSIIKLISWLLKRNEFGFDSESTDSGRE